MLRGRWWGPSSELEGQSQEGGDVGHGPTTALATFDWHSPNLCPGTHYPRTESLVRKSLEMGVVKGLFKIKTDQKNITEKVPARLCKINRWLLHANVSSAYMHMGMFLLTLEAKGKGRNGLGNSSNRLIVSGSAE